MNTKTKALRLLSLALLRLECVTRAVSRKVGEYTLASYIAEITQEEDVLFQDWLDAETVEEQNWAQRILDWATEDNTERYLQLADELDLDA